MTGSVGFLVRGCLSLVAAIIFFALALAKQDEEFAAAGVACLFVSSTNFQLASER